jgi:hypothetical protein
MDCESVGADDKNTQTVATEKAKALAVQVEH